MPVQFITNSGGEELAVLPREEYEDLVDSLAARSALTALARGEEQLLSIEQLDALLAATMSQPNRNAEPR